ncbi:MAG: NUDIX domain-containing protein [Ignavibacteria bacterium]
MPEILSKYIECYIYKKSNDGLKYLLLKRSPDKYPYPEIWQIVTGRLEANEKAYETALREVKEETGLNPVKCYVVPKINEFYTPHNDKIYLIPVFVVFAEEENVILSNEHTHFEWLNFDYAYNRIHWYTQKENLKIINDILTGKVENTMIEINF